MSIKTINQGTMYQGWEGDKYHEWCSDQELKKLLLDELKQYGIKATLRFRQGGMSTAFILTIKMPKRCLIPFDKWKLDYHYTPYNGFYFWKENGVWKSLEAECFDLNTYADQDEILEDCKRSVYEDALENMQCSCYDAERYKDFLTPEGQQILRIAKNVVNSYNHDGSCSQIDYFDRAIYDNYAIKFVEEK